MQPDPESRTAEFDTRFFPQHITMLTVGENMMPMGYWTVISKDPFRFLICMQLGNHSLILLKKYQEAAMHFLPWSERQRVVRAGYLSGRDGNKAEKLGFTLFPAEKLEHTKLIKGADSIYETTVLTELKELSSQFALFVLDVVATHGTRPPTDREPIMYLSEKDFAALGEQWRYRR